MGAKGGDKIMERQYNGTVHTQVPVQRTRFRFVYGESDMSYRVGNSRKLSHVISSETKVFLYLN